MRESSDPDLNWKSAEGSTEEALAVTTRAQKLKEEQPLKQLRVAKSIPDLTPKEIRDAREQDSLLLKLCELARAGELKQSSDGRKSKFVLQNGLLCREFQSPKVDHRNKFKQLVVPQQYRRNVMQLAH